MRNVNIERGKKENFSLSLLTLNCDIYYSTWRRDFQTTSSLLPFASSDPGDEIASPARHRRQSRVLSRGRFSHLSRHHLLRCSRSGRSIFVFILFGQYSANLWKLLVSASVFVQNHTLVLFLGSSCFGDRPKLASFLVLFFLLVLDFASWFCFASSAHVCNCSCRVKIVELCTSLS